MRFRWFWGIICILCHTKHIVDGAVLRCFSETISNHIETSLENASAILNTSYFKTDLQTVLYIFGYTGKQDDTTNSILQGFLNGKHSNVCLLDWKQEANSYLPDWLDTYGLNYPLVTELLEKVAKKMADALIKMSNNGMNLDTFECAGHSLGAEMCGEIGRRVKKEGKEISCIAAYEPASIFYQHPFKFHNPVDKNCARYVYIVHTDMRKYSLKDAHGTMDIWVNKKYYLKNKVQPSCKKNPVPLSSESYCSHRFVLQLLIESLKNPKSLIASKANSLTDWSNGYQENSTTYISGLVNKSGRGNYFLCTNSSPPYGMYEDGLNPHNCLK